MCIEKKLIVLLLLVLVCFIMLENHWQNNEEEKQKFKPTPSSPKEAINLQVPVSLPVQQIQEPVSLSVEQIQEPTEEKIQEPVSLPIEQTQEKDFAGFAIRACQQEGPNQFVPYVVQEGDGVWKIVRTNYPYLKGNKEIQKVVNWILDSNSLHDSSTIIRNSTLFIPDDKDIQKIIEN